MIISAGALRYRAWAQSWSSAALAARSVLPSNRPATPLFSPACWELGFHSLLSGVLGTGLPGLGTEHLPGALCSGTGSPALESRRGSLGAP